MSDALPGSRLHRALAACTNADTFAQLVEPTIADLQHEATTARSPSARVGALLAGYGALARVLVVCELRAPMAWARVAAIVALGVGGAALWNWARLTNMDGRVGNSALLLPTFIAPFVFRFLDRGRGYWRFFASSAAAGVVTWIALDVFVTIADPTPFIYHVVRLFNGAVYSAMASALAAGSVWSPVDDAAPLTRRIFTGLWFAGVAATAVFFAGKLLQSTYTVPFATLRAPFFVMLFAMVLAVTALPVLLVARRWTRDRLWLALVAMTCIPLPLVAGGIVDGRSLSQAVLDCLQPSLSVAALAAAYATGTATLGCSMGFGQRR